MRDRKRKKSRDIGRGEKQAPCRETDAGRLDPRTPGSRPGPKAGAKPLSHPGIPLHFSFYTQNWSFGNSSSTATS